MRIDARRFRLLAPFYSERKCRSGWVAPDGMPKKDSVQSLNLANGAVLGSTRCIYFEKVQTPSRDAIKFAPIVLTI